MNQQIKTGLGVAVILIFAVTAGVFVWSTQKNQPEVSQPTQVNIPKKVDETPKNKKCEKIDDYCLLYTKTPMGKIPENLKFNSNAIITLMDYKPSGTLKPAEAIGGDYSSFTCKSTGEMPKIVVIKSYSGEKGIEGTGFSRKAIICGNQYLIEEFLDYTGPILYGPFDLENTAKIYSIDELRNSNLPENILVKVRIKNSECQEIYFKVSEDYEGAGSGIYLNGLIKIEGGEIEEICSSKYKDKEIVISGYIGYCGGKKIPKYICKLTKVELVQVIENKSSAIDNIDDICKANTQEECESNSDCYWKYQGGKITAYYNCCPKDEEKENSPERCNIMAD